MLSYIIGHLNINSEFLNKMDKKETDILMTLQTNLNPAQFLKYGFCTLFRLDRNKNGGQILLYIRSYETSTQLNKSIIKNQ